MIERVAHRGQLIEDGAARRVGDLLGRQHVERRRGDLHEVTGDRAARGRRVATAARGEGDQCESDDARHAKVFGGLPLRVKIRA